MNEPTAILGPPTPRQIMRARYAARPGINLTGLAALFWLTLRQHARARKLVILSFLFILANVLAILVRAFNKDVTPFALEFAVVLNVIPHVMITLTALLYASAMIQDEIEEQTLTYLLIRPLPKWAIYLTKLPRVEKKVRVALGWSLDLFFSKDLVQFKTKDATVSRVGAAKQQSAA